MIFFSNQKKISAETTCPFLAGRARHVGQSRLWSRKSAVDRHRGGSSGAQESTFTPSSPSGGGCCSNGDAKLEQSIRIQKCSKHSGGFYRESGHKVQQAFNTIFFVSQNYHPLNHKEYYVIWGLKYHYKLKIHQQSKNIWAFFNFFSLIRSTFSTLQSPRTSTGATPPTSLHPRAMQTGNGGSVQTGNGGPHLVRSHSIGTPQYHVTPPRSPIVLHPPR